MLEPSDFDLINSQRFLLSFRSPTDITVFKQIASIGSLFSGSRITSQLSSTATDCDSNDKCNTAFFCIAEEITLGSPLWLVL